MTPQYRPLVSVVQRHKWQSYFLTLAHDRNNNLFFRGRNSTNSCLFFSTPAKDPHKNVAVLERLEPSTRAMGQVIFLNSITSGRVIALSLLAGDPTLAAFAALGAFTATSTSQLIGLDKKAIDDGLYGYNGALIGAAHTVFGSSFLPIVFTSTVMGAAATSVLSSSLNRACGKVPQWTWSFNAVALTSFLHTRPLLENKDSGDIDITAVNVAAENTTGFVDIAASPLMGLSQIFVVGSPLTGAGIVAAIGMYSPKLALHALGGSATGCLVGILSGADLSNVALGLWGYNSALTSMAVGTFFVNSRQTLFLSAAGAGATAALFGAMQSVFGAYGAPCLTLPFCTVASACYLLERQIPGLVLAKEPHSPEKNLP